MDYVVVVVVVVVVVGGGVVGGSGGTNTELTYPVKWAQCGKVNKRWVFGRGRI